MDPAIVALIGALSKGIVDTWVAPKLKEMFEKNEIDKNFYTAVSDKFADYLKESYKNQFIMNTIVFKNQQKTIEELYIPLHLNKVSNDVKNKESIRIDGYDDEFIPKFRKLIITDTAGMGKSTIMKWLFISVIKHSKGIPIFIELRKLSEQNSIIKEIFKNINSINEEFNVTYVLNLLKRGDFIFFFDGYDEIPTKDKASVTADLQWFISKVPENLFVMSSREESALVSFGDFQRFNIKPLEYDEAYELIKKYDKDGEVSKELIQKLKQDNNLNLVKEFLVNPLMTSLLYRAYEYKKVIPYKKSLFYRQVYDALFELHDLSKGGAYVHDKISQLDMDDFEEILKFISYKSFIKGKVIYEREEIISLIKEAKESNPKMQFKERDFLEDLEKNVPLLIKDGLEYKWTHKSFQEYFAAKYICHNLKDRQKAVLLKMARSIKNDYYFNILDFCYDIDYNAFRKTVIFDLISNFIDYYNNQTVFNDLKLSKKDICERKILTFSNKIFFYKCCEFRGTLRPGSMSEAVENSISKEIGNFKELLTTGEFGIGRKLLPASNIIRLLKDKKEDFVIPHISIYEKKLVFSFDLPKDKLLIVDECNDNLLNKGNNFIEVNKIINYFINNDYDLEEEFVNKDAVTVFTLDLNKCMRLIREIELEIELEQNEDEEF